LNSIKEGVEHAQELRIKGKDGNFRWFLARAVPQRDETGQIKRWIGTTTDIHKQKLDLEKKDEFVGIASHELKTPLTTVKAYAELLEKETLNSVTDESSARKLSFIGKMNQSIKKLQGLIDDLLDVSKIQSGKMVYNMEDFSFMELANSIVEISQNSNTKHNIVLKGNANRIVTGDKMRLEQVLTNYLNNAIKYAPDSEEIIVDVQEKNKDIIVCVEDFGPGFPENEKERLFDRFYRSSSPTKASGMGIGLYLCKEIVSRHNGKVWAEKKETNGSRFFFSIPVNF
jgi:signal transduction histidine kinase